MDSTTNNTRVKVPAFSSAGVSQGHANRTYDALISKPNLDSSSGRGRNGVDMLNEKRFLISQKKIMLFGTWNVRTLMATGVVTMLLHESNRFRCDVIGIAETHWLDVPESVVCGCKIISSGRTEGHSSEVGLLLSRDAQQSLMSYNPVML